MNYIAALLSPSKKYTLIYESFNIPVNFVTHAYTFIYIFQNLFNNNKIKHNP